MIVALVCVGVLTALTGRRRRAVRRREQRDDEYLDLLGVLVAGLDAGVHPMDSISLCARGRDTSDVAARTADAWMRRGSSIDECLGILAAHFDDGTVTTGSSRRGSQLADALRSHLLDGQPLQASIDALTRDFDEWNRRTSEARVRELPIRLSPPLVLCILPSFMLACTLPLAAMARDSLVGTGPGTFFTPDEETR